MSEKMLYITSEGISAIDNPTQDMLEEIAGGDAELIRVKNGHHERANILADEETDEDEDSDTTTTYSIDYWTAV